MKKTSFNKNTLFDIVRSTIIAVLISLILVLIFSLLVNLLNIKEAIIMPINQVIKTLSILFGCFIGIKEGRNGALKGGMAGLLYTLLSIVIFGLISHAVKFNMLNLIDIALGIVTGAISGILAVNLKKRVAA